jgi:hypothetical protein
MLFDLNAKSLEHLVPHNRRPSHAYQIPESSKPFKKICAKLRSGVRFGIGFVLERSCGEECLKCSGTAFQRQCRHFNFRPHYEVKLEKKPRIPLVKVMAFSRMMIVQLIESRDQRTPSISSDRISSISPFLWHLQQGLWLTASTITPVVFI